MQIFQNHSLVHQQHERWTGFSSVMKKSLHDCIPGVGIKLVGITPARTESMVASGVKYKSEVESGYQKATKDILVLRKYPGIKSSIFKDIFAFTAGIVRGLKLQNVGVK